MVTNLNADKPNGRMMQMTNELQKALAELIKQSLNAVDFTQKFAVEQSPDVDSQLLTWYIIYQI